MWVFKKVLPKSNQGAYFHYQRCNKHEFKGISSKKAIQKLAKQFRELDQKDKAKYEQMAAEDKLRYQKEMEEFNEKGEWKNELG